MLRFLLAIVYLLFAPASLQRMFPDERTSLYDCLLRFHRVEWPVGIFPVYGIETRFQEFPHMAAIGWTQPNGTILWNCGGSLIWDNFVLTAAHCVFNSHNGAADVVRLGDNDLYSSDDDDWVQQFRIESILRHPKHNFSSRYHDIALLKLSQSVDVFLSGIPACLWEKEEVRFKELVATGWGRVGEHAETTPKLLKVVLKPITNKNCSNSYPIHRKIRQGLQGQQLCARDEKMDTCDGDSGGPLEVKLMHNARMTPFIVGITSFGSGCGRSNPGVYTRVSSYFEWIVDTMRQNRATGLEENYNETLCALKYVSNREFVENFGGRSLDEILYYMKARRYRIEKAYKLPPQMATIQWNDRGPDCYGVIVDEDTVLTVADCVNFEGNPPSSISYLDDKFIQISEILVHPEHVRGSAYNNIAILKLRQVLDLPEHFLPSCISDSIDYDRLVYGYGKGRKDINDQYWENYTIDPQIIDLKIRFEYHNTSTCKVPAELNARMRHGLAEEHLCVGHDVFLVPGSCEQLTGSMIGASGLFFYTTHALTLLSRDCGFGEHLISTRLSSHAEWMKSVLLPKNSDSSARTSNIGTSNRLHSDVLNCSILVESLDVVTNKGSQANIGWVSNNTTEYRCIGSIISHSFIITTASCLGESPPNVVQLMAFGDLKMVHSVLIHSDFNETDRTNDIALVKLRYPLIWSASIYPICLWMNKTHTPLEMDINYITQNEPDTFYEYGLISTLNKLHPMYNSDCQKAHQYEIPESQLCTRSPYHSAHCVAPSDQLIWMEPFTNPRERYLVGLSTNLCVQVEIQCFYQNLRLYRVDQRKRVYGLGFPLLKNTLTHFLHTIEGCSPCHTSNSSRWSNPCSKREGTSQQLAC